MELVVFVLSLKFFLVEGGEQFIVGIQTAKKLFSFIEIMIPQDLLAA
jgi:hypothetical protein